MKNGYFIISLDFELLWGVFDIAEFLKKKEYFWNTRQIIPEILKEFENKEIHATWATVGMLFNENWEEWRQNIPKNIPSYHNKMLSAYDFGTKHFNKRIEELCFAPELISRIIRVPGQEMASHTYSHYYCKEPGQEINDFKSDIEMAVKLAKKFNIELKSLVFPRNQISDDYLTVCMDVGITNVRSNPTSWYWKDTRSENPFTRLARTGDAYIPLGNKTYFLDDVNRMEYLPIEQKASRFYRPVEENKVLRKLKLRRVKKEMEIAAKRNKIYHLWWHPHNFGDQPEKSMNDLKDILGYFQTLKKKYNFQSANMKELGELIS